MQIRKKLSKNSLWVNWVYILQPYRQTSLSLWRNLKHAPIMGHSRYRSALAKWRMSSLYLTRLHSALYSMYHSLSNTLGRMSLARPICLQLEKMAAFFPNQSRSLTAELSNANISQFHRFWFSAPRIICHTPPGKTTWPSNPTACHLILENKGPC